MNKIRDAPILYVDEQESVSKEKGTGSGRLPHQRKPYARFTKRLQWCWAHLLREPEDIAEKFEEALPLYNALKELYDHERVLY